MNHGGHAYVLSRWQVLGPDDVTCFPKPPITWAREPSRARPVAETVETNYKHFNTYVSEILFIHAVPAVTLAKRHVPAGMTPIKFPPPLHSC